MTEIIHQIAIHLNHLRVAEETNDLDGFYMVLRDLAHFALEAEVEE